MFFFVDESWQKVGGVAVGALGCVAIPAAEYNRFCRVVYRIKQDQFGAKELQDNELKGNRNFCKAAFKAHELQGVSPSLAAVDHVLDALYEADAAVIALSAVGPTKLSIRDGDSSFLTDPYVDLILRMYALMKGHRDKRGLLFFDQVGHREDQRAACAVQNFFVRTRYTYPFSKLFIQVPHFTHSSVSPGLQVADLIAYLCAHTTNDFADRPELRPWWEAFARFGYEARVKGEERSSIAPFAGATEAITRAAETEPLALLELENPADMMVTGEP